MVADESSKAEEEEVDGGEDVGGGEGAPVGGEVSPHLHLVYWASRKEYVLPVPENPGASVLLSSPY